MEGGNFFVLPSLFPHAAGMFVLKHLYNYSGGLVVINKISGLGGALACTHFPIFYEKGVPGKPRK